MGDVLVGILACQDTLCEILICLLCANALHRSLPVINYCSVLVISTWACEQTSFFSGLSSDIGESDIHNTFSKYGDIEYIDLIGQDVADLYICLRFVLLYRYYYHNYIGYYSLYRYM